LEGHRTLHETLKRSGEVSKASVEDALKREEDRYTKERIMAPEKEYVAELVAIYSNFVAAETAFATLVEHLEKFV
jgi:hypothetical protein